jgi:SAM-dependent methyltransferase
MNLSDLRANWERLAAGDAFHSILYRAEKHDEKWDEEAFFESGLTEIEGMLGQLAALHRPVHTSRALDFGCAAGRLTQGLKRYFDEVVGVDISAAMIEHANRFNRYGEACRYVHNPQPHLRLFEDDRFDLIYSNITLQHNEPRYQRAYMHEFVRVLKPGGHAVFQVPSRCVDSLKHRVRIQAPYPVKKAFHKLKSLLGSSADDAAIEMPMYVMSRRKVEHEVRSAGGRVLHVAPNDCAGTSYESFWYFVTKGD